MSLQYDAKITSLSEVNMSLILVHGGKSHYPSKLALEKWGKYSGDSDYLQDIEVVDNRVKQWLTCNDRGVSINEIPCILFCRGGIKTIVYSIGQLDTVMGSL